MAGLLALLTVVAGGPPTVADALARLDLTRPGLEAVRAAADAGDHAAAAVALKAYYQARPTPALVGDPNRPMPDFAYNRSSADAVLRREFAFVGKPAVLTHDIDWTADPHGDIEWPIELNRHFFFRTLVDAWWRTGDSKYLDDALYMLDDWIADCPQPERDSFRGPWRTLECGLRLQGGWPTLFWRAVQTDAFTPELLCRMLASTAQQCDWLLRYPKGNNWLLMERCGVLTTAALFPEFADAPRWKDAAWQTLSREMTAQVYPDGAQGELTPHYGRVCVDQFRLAADIARDSGIDVPAEFLAGLERMYEYLLYLVKPDGFIPMLNDSDHDNERTLLARGADLFGRDDMRYVATGGARGTTPELTSVAFPWAGQYLLRSGWTLDDVYLCLDAGPYGTGHQHEDKLGIDVWGYGDELIADPGRYTYVGGKWRGYFVGTASHSTVLVDGAGQRRGQVRSSWVARSAQPNRFHVDDEVAFAGGSYEEGHANGSDLIHIRRARLERQGGYYVIDDLLLPRGKADGEHTMTVQYQLAHPGAALDEPTLRVVGGGDTGSILLGPADPAGVEVTVHEGEEDPPAGWVAWSLHQARKDPATLVRYTVRGTPPLRFRTILVPHRTGTTPTWPTAIPPRAELMGALPDPAPGAGDAGQVEGPITHPAASAECRLRWGYAGDDQGFLFEAGPDADGSWRIANPLFDVPYRWALILPDGRYLATGTWLRREPDRFTFDAGETDGWTGTIARPGAGDDGACLRSEGPPTTEAQYATLTLPRRLTSGPDLHVSLDWRAPAAEAGDWFYAKVTLVDVEGRFWSHYFAREPSATWRRLTLGPGDFTGDSQNTPELGRPLPAGVAIREVQIVGRKGITAQPTTMALELDNVTVSGD